MNTFKEFHVALSFIHFKLLLTKSKKKLISRRTSRTVKELSKLSNSEDFVISTVQLLYEHPIIFTSVKKVAELTFLYQFTLHLNRVE